MGWTDGISLEQRIIFLITTNQTQSEEFKTYLLIYGREKIKSYWLKYKESQKQVERSHAVC